MSHAFIKPSGYVAVVQNNHGDFIVIGDQYGHPFESQRDALDFAAAYEQAVPYAVRVVTAAIHPSGLDVDDETHD